MTALDPTTTFPTATFVEDDLDLTEAKAWLDEERRTIWEVDNRAPVFIVADRRTNWE